jgi:poly-beta-hydroxyalkanoate depolymerase
MTGDLHA